MSIQKDSKSVIDEIKDKIQSCLNDEVNKKSSYLSSGCIEEGVSLASCVVQLRCAGVPIQLPATYTELGGMAWIEAASEILRQIEVYQHPVKNWFISNLATLINIAVSASAVFITIHK